jgi:hypothetical protein
MAAHTLPVLSRPAFPQTFIGAIEHMIDSLAVLQFNRCAFEDEHCDCREYGVVYHLAGEQDLCVRHFQAVTRG